MEQVSDRVLSDHNAAGLEALWSQVKQQEAIASK
jgi:hypothetical protein